MTFDRIAIDLLSVAGPVIGFVIWLIRREFERTDKLVTILENHFKHDEAVLEEIKTHMAQTNETLGILLDRTHRV